MKALVTGQREGLSPRPTAHSWTPGAVHILSLSGLHMGVIYGILHQSLAWTGRSRPAAFVKAALTIIAAAFFTLMTGSSPSVVRAVPVHNDKRNLEAASGKKAEARRSAVHGPDDTARRRPADYPLAELPAFLSCDAGHIHAVPDNGGMVSGKRRPQASRCAGCGARRPCQSPASSSPHLSRGGISAVSPHIS